MAHLLPHNYHLADRVEVDNWRGNCPPDNWEDNNFVVVHADNWEDQEDNLEGEDENGVDSKYLVVDGSAVDELEGNGVGGGDGSCGGEKVVVVV